MKLGGLINTIPEVLVLYALVTGGLVTLIASLEGWSAGEAAWWAVVTVTTTGYGDMAPHAPFGRFLAGLLMAAAWFFNLLLGAQVAAKLIVNSDAWTHAEQEDVKTTLHEIRDRMP